MLTMWKIPVSESFQTTLAFTGFLGTVPLFEQKYLGDQLTKSGTSAVKVSIDENDLRLSDQVVIQGRTFYMKDKFWYVKVDTK